MIRCLIAGAAVAGVRGLPEAFDRAGVEGWVETSISGTVASCAAWRPHVVIAGTALTDGSVVELVAAVRGRSSVPLLVVAPDTTPAERVELLDRGADDVLGHAVAADETIAYVRAALACVGRHLAMVGAPPGELRAGALWLDLVARRRAMCGERELSLTPTEFDLLAHLMAREGVAINRASLVKQVWGDGPPPRSNVVDRQIGALRRKLEPDAAGYLQTVPRVGYRLRRDPVDDIRWLAPAQPPRGPAP